MSQNKKILFILSAVLIICMAAPFAGWKSSPAQNEIGIQEQLTLEDLQAINGGSVDVYTHNDRVTFVSGSCTPDPVRNIEDAGEVVVSMIGLLGGDARTRFESWRTLTDSTGNQYYVFQQMYANTTVLGGAVKVITDPEGNMIGLTSSIETELPDSEESEGITAGEAEQIVLQHAAETNQPEPALVSGYTAKIILPIVTAIDLEDESEGARFVWVVYTDNPESRLSISADLPYLAHYVTMDGEYLYNLPTIIPGDTAGETGFDAAYVFEFMEPADYTGYVDLSDGTEMELTVTLMRDKRTGMYYLGNIERQIVVGDFYEFIYNNGRVVLASSPDNLEWDQVGLLAFYNYCRVWDYYKELGWIGGDGRGTPILILNDFCDESHNRINNAVFMGNYLGWSLFGASLVNDFSQTIDVIAHEFTHCVTDAVMTYNSYHNDYGAINEAISDIQGQICDLMNGNETDTDWVLGDKSVTPVRSMSDPNDFTQPEFSWDLYYVPAVRKPTGINDAGGVHSNSSLLNNIAYRLVANGGMSLEEARAFWFAVDCAMVPGTDYAQLAELLPWVLEALGMEQYQPTMQQAIDAVRLGNTALPDFFDDDRALVTLSMPDNENFTDDNWMMQIYSVEIHGLAAKIRSLIDLLSAHDYSSFPLEIQELLSAESEPKHSPGFWETLGNILTAISDETEKESEPEETDEDLSIVMAWLQNEFRDYFYSGNGSAGQDGHTIRMVTRPGRTIPILFHAAINDLSPEPDQVVTALFVSGKWLILPDMNEMAEQDPADDLTENPILEYLIDTLLENIDNINSIDDFLDLFTVNIKAGSITEIPSDGLETVVLPAPSEISEDASDEPAELPEPGKKSRPKL